MCELEPPISTVPDFLIIELEFIESLVGIKYLQEDILWELIGMDGHPR